MSYMPHIDNLYKDQTILMFKEIFALEKIHGTNTKISFFNGEILFASGGEKHERFVSLFNSEFLISKFRELGLNDITIFGEAYGGKQQGMSDTYGKELKFVAFDVKIGDNWLDVPNAEQIVKNLGLEFVSYFKISTDLKEIDAQRDLYSMQAVRNGITTYGINGCVENPKVREGVVLRPIIELTKNNGERIICKHKCYKFSEIKSPREIDINKLQILKDAELISQEWVTKNRLEHILQRVPDPNNITNIPIVIARMFEDIKREGEKEIVWSKYVEKAIGKDTAKLFKDRLKSQLG